MEARAVARYVRISPQKARRIIRLIKGKGAVEAMSLLRHMPQKGAFIIGKVLRSAVANAENNFEMSRKDLVVSKAYVDQGPTIKRWRARMRGVPVMIRKRTSHITVVVEEREG